MSRHEPPQTPPASAARREWGLTSPGLGLSLGGVHAPHQTARHQRLIALAETLGLHSVWLPEMHFQPGVCPAPLMELAGYAATTRRLRLGTTSLLLPLHPPETLAAEIATLDRLSEGRLLVGLGRGFQKPMLEAFGVPPAQKRDRFDDALARMRAVWAAGPDARAARAHPPLAVAAFGPKGLAQAARHGLPYLASPVETFDQIAENQRRHRDQLPDGHSEPLHLLMRTLFVSHDAGEQQAVRTALRREMSGPRRNMPAAVDRALDAPLEDRALVGTPDQVLERLLAERQRLGIDLLVTRPLIADIAEEALERSLRLLAEEVWPRFRASAPEPSVC